MEKCCKAEQIVIRDLRFEDFNYFKDLMDEVHELHVKNRPDIYEKADKLMTIEEFSGLIKSKKTITIGAELNSKIIALCIITIKEISGRGIVNRKIGYMEDLCVLTGYRGNGIGKKLLNEAENRLKQLNVQSLELMVWEFNKNAKSFYEKNRFNTRSRIMQFNIEY